MQHTEHNQEHTCHQRGYGQSLKSVLLYNAVDNDDKRTGRSAYLHFRTSQHRHYQSSNDGSNDTLLRCYTRCDTECDGQWQRHDTNYDTGQQVGGKLLFVVVPKSRQKFRLECKCCHHRSIITLLS